jgi:DNA-binding HxlR family transcriptional regulator
MLFLYQKGQARHAEIAKLTASRGTLSLSLRDLEQEQLIQRKVLDTKPPRSIYSLTEKGKTIAKQLKEIQQYIT